MKFQYFLINANYMLATSDVSSTNFESQLYI